MASNPDPVLPPIPDADSHLHAALALLWGHYECALLLHGHAAELALTVEELLHETAVAPEQLVGLYTAGLLERAEEGAGGAAVASLAPATFLTLTPAGAVYAQQVLRLATIKEVKPSWDGRVFRLRRLVLREFRRYPADQGPLLDALEAAGWPRRVNNPLEPKGRRDSAKRLRDAVRQLNRGQNPWLIRFSSEPQGKGMRWTMRTPSV